VGAVRTRGWRRVCRFGLEQLGVCLHCVVLEDGVFALIDSSSVLFCLFCFALLIEGHWQSVWLIEEGF
jgi:NMD protein affecting ribosome stability and mRNA decay